MPYKDKAKQSAYQVAWADRRRRDWLSQNGPCQCGSDDRLEVDHVDPTKKVSHRIWFWSDERRKMELEKCQVLCYDCHLEKTLEQRPKADHGGSGMYGKGCRCVTCTEYQRVRVADWRRKNKSLAE
jgi:hypothetical protein